MSSSISPSRNGGGGGGRSSPTGGPSSSSAAGGGGGGTLLGLGTIGLGEAFGKATDKQIEEDGMKAFWASWQRTKLEWEKSDEGRNRKVIEMLNQDRSKRAMEASRQRELTIMRMQEDRKMNEEARRKEAEKEAAEQCRVNKLVTDAIKREREQGIVQRREDRLAELSELHRERELMLEMNALDKSAQDAAVKAHRQKMSDWYMQCKEEARRAAADRLEARKAAVAAIKEGKARRDEDAKATREGILKAKAGLVKVVAATHDNGKMAVFRTSQQRTKQSDEMRHLVAREKVIAQQRAEEHREARSKMVKELQERTRAARQQYEDEQRREKERLQEAVAAQKVASRELQAIETRERLEAQSVHIANVRALVNRRRTESRVDVSSDGRRRSSKARSRGEEEVEAVTPYY